MLWSSPPPWFRSIRSIRSIMSILELTYALVFPHPLDLGQFGQLGQLCQFLKWHMFWLCPHPLILGQIGQLCRFLNFMSLLISSIFPLQLTFFADNGLPMMEVLEKFDLILNLPPQFFYMSNNVSPEIISDINSP